MKTEEPLKKGSSKYEYTNYYTQRKKTDFPKGTIQIYKPATLPLYKRKKKSVQ